MSEQPVPLVFADARAWAAWLAENEELSDGIWLMLAKKNQPSATTVTYAEALDVALCSGWIDGQARSLDVSNYMQRFTPRRKRSLWSMRNVGYIARLAEEGRLRPRGLMEVERAKQDGRWDAAYAGPASIEVPPDLIEALALDSAAKATFDSLNSQNRYAVLHRIATALTPKTRQARLERLVAMLHNGERPHP